MLIIDTEDWTYLGCLNLLGSREELLELAGNLRALLERGTSLGDEVQVFDSKGCRIRIVPDQGQVYEPQTFASGE